MLSRKPDPIKITKVHWGQVKTHVDVEATVPVLNTDSDGPLWDYVPAILRGIPVCGSTLLWREWLSHGHHGQMVIPWVRFNLLPTTLPT